MPENIDINFLLELTSSTTTLFIKDMQPSIIDFMYDSISENEATIFSEVLKRKYHLKGHNNIVEDIVNIDELFPPIERIYYMLNKKNKNHNGELQELEEAILRTFTELLDKHISTSKNANKEYLETLLNFKRYIKFKYNSCKNKTINVDTEEKNRYIYEIFINIINSLNEISDDEYEDEHIYAKGILLQLLLRSIIVIINDKNIIEPFEEKEDNPSISKSIIESAFNFRLNDLRKAS